MPAADPFVLACPSCLTPLDATDPAVGVGFDAVPAAVMTRCPAGGPPPAGRPDGRA